MSCARGAPSSLTIVIESGSVGRLGCHLIGPPSIASMAEGALPRRNVVKSGPYAVATFPAITTSSTSFISGVRGLNGLVV